METIKEKHFTGERALFKSNNLFIKDCIFDDGESPLKESNSLTIEDSIFGWKYPLWYCHNVQAQNTTLLETARSGIWYTNNIQIKDSVIAAPKTFRRGNDIQLENISMPNAQETLWNCKNIELDHVYAKGDYFGMNSENIKASHFELVGNYCFDGAKNIEMHNVKLISKDAFWNTENVTVYDSLIVGEYLGWNSKNLTLVNCTIESLQGLCYIENLTLINCKLIHTSLAFEYCSNIDASITSEIDSVLNPISGTIRAKNIKELILEEDKIDPNKTKIILDK